MNLKLIFSFVLTLITVLSTNSYSQDSNEIFKEMKGFAQQTKFDKVELILWCENNQGCFISGSTLTNKEPILATNSVSLSRAIQDASKIGKFAVVVTSILNPPRFESMEHEDMVISLIDALKEKNHELIGLTFMPEGIKAIALKCILTKQCR